MEITFRNVHLSFQEYASANLQYAARRQRLRLLLLPLALFVGISAAVFSSHAEADTRASSTTGQWWLYGVVGALGIGAVAYGIRRGIRQRYDRTQFLQKPATYIFTDAGITVEAPSVQGINTWDTIDSLLLMKQLAVLTTRNFTVYFLDFRCLEAPATQADFLALLQRHRIPVS